MFSHRTFVELCPLFQTCQEIQSALEILGLDQDDINYVEVEINNGKSTHEICQDMQDRSGIRIVCEEVAGRIINLFGDGGLVQKLWKVRFKFLTQRTCCIMYIILVYSGYHENLHGCRQPILE